MTILHRPFCELCFSTGFERDDHVITDHDTRYDGPALAAVPAGVVAER